MGAASVTLDGKTLFSGACGWADAEWNVKNTVDTRFDIASITKEFTAVAVLLLYEQKKFALADPIGKYVQNLPDSWQSATIHQLLTHTSGVPMYTAIPDCDHVRNRLNLLGDVPNELLSLVRDRPLMHDHGAKFTYNNSGYILLGMLIEKVSGTPYPRFIQEQISTGLECTTRDTTIRAKSSLGTPRATALPTWSLRTCHTLIPDQLGRRALFTLPFKI
jgi:D-alanyl-D-alanine carboxypeptidase